MRPTSRRQRPPNEKYARSSGSEAEETAEAFWLDPQEAVARHVEGGRSRLDEAFAARLEGLTTYLDADRRIPAR